METFLGDLRRRDVFYNQSILHPYGKPPLKVVLFPFLFLSLNIGFRVKSYERPNTYSRYLDKIVSIIHFILFIIFALLRVHGLYCYISQYYYYSVFQIHQNTSIKGIEK